MDSFKLINSNGTHVNGVYIENKFNAYFLLSLVQTFIVSFISELGDKTFLLILILKIKHSNINTVFWSALLAMTSINLISIVIGLLLDIFLYQNFIDILAIAVFVLIGLTQIINSFEMKSKTFEEEMITCIRDEIKYNKKKKQIKRTQSMIQKKITKQLPISLSGGACNSSSNNLYEPLLEYNYQSQIIPNSSLNVIGSSNNTNYAVISESQQQQQGNIMLQEDYNNEEVVSPKGSSNDNYYVDNVNDNEKEKERMINEDDSVCKDNKNEKNYFWLFFKSIFITEFGDRTQFGMAAISSIYNIVGVVVGSFIGLGVIVYIACYYGESAAKKIIEKQMCIIVGFVFLGLSIEIYYSNNYLRII
jgi:putative Ca2+/H+ antiporter (TMEM165/GDT1 family)